MRSFPRTWVPPGGHVELGNIYTRYTNPQNRDYNRREIRISHCNKYRSKPHIYKPEHT